MKRFVSMILVLAMVLCVAGCGSDTEQTQAPTQGTTAAETAAETDGGEAGAYTPGTYTATATGYGGEVTVEMTFDASSITDVKITGDDETAGIGSNAVEQMPAQILEAQSADVDGVSGATFSSNAIRTAAADCIAQASGESGTAEVKMAPGSYTAYSESYRAGDGLNVTVTVSETEIESIEVDTENTSDTPTILQAAIDNLIPRMLEYQSVSVDAVCGATTSSNAIKAATETAVKEALVAGGSDESAISNFYVSIPESGETVELETEVLVVGMGGSGTTAALSAAESGAQVLAIDKAGRYGGTSSITSEALFVNPPRFQEEHNNGEDYTDADVMYNDWIEYAEGDAKEEIVARMIYESGEVLDWLVYDHGVGFAEPQTGFTETDVYLTKYQWLPNDIMYNKAEIGAYFDGMYDDFEELGGTYMLETEGYELIYDEESNTVTGVKARSMVDGTEYVITADAVVIATGGYAGSADMELELLRNDYYPLNGVWKHLGSTQNDGKMLQAAMDIGAGVYNISMPPEVHNSGTETWLTTEFEAHYIDGEVGKVTGRPAFWTEGDLPANMGWSADSLAVDANGERFTAETGVSFLDPWIAGPNYYSIWSSSQIDKLVAEGFDTDRSGPSAEFLSSGTPIPIGTPIENAYEVLDAAVEAGIAVKGDTIEELAEALGMAPATLSATVETYNSYCESGVDEQFGKAAELLDPVEEGPYYAIIMASYCYGSCGGLDINEHFQVLQDDGETVINGLYCVGTDAMGVLFTEKKPYVTYGGANNGWGLVSGYLCGREIAEALGYSYE